MRFEVMYSSCLDLGERFERLSLLLLVEIPPLDTSLRLALDTALELVDGCLVYCMRSFYEVGDFANIVV